MKRNQAFVRAKIDYYDKEDTLQINKHTIWVNADVLDLTQESFNAFVLRMLCRAGIVVHIKDEAIPNEPEVPNEIRPELIEDYIKKWHDEN